MEFIASQFVQVLRRLRRAPMFTLITLLTLAAGVGANTAVFSVIDGVLLKPLPYPHPEQLVGLWHTAPGLNIPELNMAASNYFIYREQSRTFQDVGVYNHDSVSVTGIGEPEQVSALDVSDGVLPILGVQPLLGRLFTKQDTAPNAPGTIILTYGYWQRKFGGSPAVIGRTMIADGKQHVIIGVLPASFRFLDMNDLAVILPMTLDRDKTTLAGFNMQGLARMKPGVTIAQADADVARMLPIVTRSFPMPPGISIGVFKQARIGPNLHPLMQDVVGDVGKLLWVLMGSVGLVLLIACANVSNLLLARTEGRQQELAIRASLGASQRRIGAELFFESGMLGLAGGVLGLGLAWGGLHVLVALAPAGLPRIGDVGINLPVLLFALGVALLSSCLVGIIPVWKYAGARAGTGLREGGRTLSAGRTRHRARNVLVTVQVALAFVLLVCSGLMIRTFHAMTHVQPGFTEPGHVQTFHVFIPSAEAAKPEDVVAMQQAIVQKLAAIPGVQSVAFAHALPMDGNRWNDPIWVENRNTGEGKLPPLRRFVFVSPGYFSTMGIPLIAGRDYTWADLDNKLPLAILSEKVAREYWSNPGDALGQRIRVTTNDGWKRIIGVVGNVHYDGVDQKVPDIVYWPAVVTQFEDEPVQVRRAVAFVIRSPLAGTQNFLGEVRKAVWSVNANLPLARVHTMAYYYGNSISRTSFTLVMLAIAGVMALLLGTVGLYGVIAYSVSQRTREMGIRMALGAERGQLTVMFVRQGLVLTGIGLGVGAGAALSVMWIMSSLLFNVSPMDPLTYGAVAIGLAATALLASYVPSHRAAAVDPVEALRSE